MKYPKAGDLQKQLTVTLTANPSMEWTAEWTVESKGDRGRAFMAKRNRRGFRSEAAAKQWAKRNLTAEELKRADFYEEPAENPAIDRDDADAAVDKYKEFHRFDPKALEELGELVIPRRVRKLGAAKYVLYRSDKVDPATLKKPARPVDYIHEHDAGVTVYVCDGKADTDVPASICEVTALVKLGKCLGYALRDGTEAEGTPPLPDLACTPDGKCLLVIQGKKKVLAMVWGGALGVFARGIDG